MSRIGTASGLILIAGALAFVGCGPAGLWPTLAPAPPPGRLGSPLSQALSGQRRLTDLPERVVKAKSPVYYRFTRAERSQLRQATCAFEPTSQRARRMARRGFSAAEIIQSCRDVRRYAGGDLRALEQLAAYRRAGLDLARYGEVQRSRLSLTGYYNRKHIGGRGLALAGWILTITGGIFLGTALVMLASYGIAAAHCANRPGACGDLDGALSGFGYPILAAISVSSVLASLPFLLPGLPLLIVGESRLRTWLRGELLDVGHVRDLDRFRLRYLAPQRRPALRVSFAPLLTRGGAGLSLQLQW